MIEKKICALEDFTLSTGVESHMLSTGQVIIVLFKSEQEFHSLLKFNKFRAAHPHEEEQKPLHHIAPPTPSPHDEFLINHTLLPQVMESRVDDVKAYHLQKDEDAEEDFTEESGDEEASAGSVETDGDVSDSEPTGERRDLEPVDQPKGERDSEASEDSRGFGSWFSGRR